MNAFFILSLIICGLVIAFSMATINAPLFTASVTLYFVIAIAMYVYNRNKK